MPLSNKLAHPSYKLALLVTLVITCSIYWIGLYGPWMLDDYNVVLQLGAPAPSWQAWFETLFGAQNDYPRLRVLANLSFIFNDILLKMPEHASPFSYKLTNVLLHCLTGLYIFRIVRALLMQWSLNQRSIVMPNGSIITISVITTALFLLHPLQVSTVLYVVQRMTILSALFSAIAIWEYLKWRIHSQNHPTKISLLPVIKVWIFIGLACLCKENGILASVLIGVIEWTVYRPQSFLRTPRKQRWAYLFLLLPALLAIGMLLIQLPNLPNTYHQRDFTLTERLVTQGHVLFYYLRLILLPWLGGFSLHHDDFPTANIHHILNWLPFISIIFIASVACVKAKKYPLVCFCILWFLVCHSMESTVIALEMVFEHRNYLALVGPILGLIVLLAHMLGTALKILIPSLCSFIIAHALLTMERTVIWSDNALWVQHQVITHPQSLRARTLYLDLLLKQKDISAASILTAQTMRDFPNSAKAGVLRLVLACGELPQRGAELQRIQDRFTHGFIESDTNRWMHLLIRAKANQQCSNISWDELIHLNQLAIQHLEKEKRYGLANHWQFLLASSYFYSQQWPLAIHTLQQLIQKSPRVNYFNMLLQAQHYTEDTQGAARTYQLMQQRAKTDFTFPKSVLPSSDATR